MTPAWLVPTGRSTSWPPLIVTAVSLAAVSATSTYLGRWPMGLLGVAAATLAAAVVAGLHDPAAALLAAVPTSAATRRARRLALLVPVGLATWLAFVWAGRQLEPTIGWPLGAVVALTATGLAVAVWAPARISVAAGVTASLSWCAAAKAAGGLGEEYDAVLFAWQHHPWIVTVAALAALLLGRNR